MKWFTKAWWKYLFSSIHPIYYKKSYKWPSWIVIFCRARGHDSVIWYDVAGLVPDMHCKCCGEDLG